MTTGEKIKHLRKAQNISQEQLADMLELSRQAVSRWETGNAVPETGVVVKLSEIFQVTTDYLLKENENQKNVYENTVTTYLNKKMNKNLIIGIIGIVFPVIVSLIVLFMSIADPVLRTGSNGEVVNIWNWNFWVSNQLVPLALVIILVLVTGIYHLGKYYFQDI